MSYDNKNTTALCLYGRVFSEQLKQYEQAKDYFQEAISININALEVYPYYIDTLVLNDDNEEAMKLIDFAITLKGISKVEILIKKIILLEKLELYLEAKKIIKIAKISQLNSDFNFVIEESEKRIKKKIGLNKSKKTKKVNNLKKRKL